MSINLLFSNPLLRLETLTGREAAHAIDAALKFDWKWFSEPFIRPLAEQEFALFFYFALTAIIIVLFKHLNHKTAFLLLWIIPIFLYFSFGTTSLSEYKPLERLPRYHSAIIVPVVILISYWLMQIQSIYVRRGLITLICISSITACLIDNSRFAMEKERHVTDFINSAPETHFLISRPIFYDYMYLSSFNPTAKVSLLAAETDLSDDLKRSKLVNRHAKEITRLSESNADLLVIRDSYLERYQINDERKGKLLKEFAGPRRAYHRLLEFSLVKVLLKVVRGEGRYRRLMKLGEDKITIYHLEKLENADNRL